MTTKKEEPHYTGLEEIGISTRSSGSKLTLQRIETTTLASEHLIWPGKKCLKNNSNILINFQVLATSRSRNKCEMFFASAILTANTSTANANNTLHNAGATAIGKKSD